MTTRVLIDNDVIIKTAAYGFGNALAGIATIGGTPPAMLGVGRYVVRDRLSRQKRFADGVAALARFEALLPELQLLEPTGEELAAAADFETAAAKSNLELDGGESQLLAILLYRAADLLITGDKRAIVAIASIAPAKAQGRVACFEQVVATIVEQIGPQEARAAVCSEPLADKAMTICCSCSSATVPEVVDMLAAIESYTSHLRLGAAGVLYALANLSSLAA